LPAQLFDQLHPDWRDVLNPYAGSILRIERELSGVQISPRFENVFRSLGRSIESTQVVIFGQDPYPTQGHADGLAFSVDKNVSSLPPSLRNIFKELATDCGVTRNGGDLSDWFDQGVMLINRILTTNTGSSLTHSDIGWQEITDAVARELGKRQVVAILWGKSAGELSVNFHERLRIDSVHPSPLSAYRGFFGSKPFSRCNAILLDNGKKPIQW
jgi:uracil-DNA glycosylase